MPNLFSVKEDITLSVPSKCNSPVKPCQDRSWFVSSPLSTYRDSAHPLSIPTDISFISNMREVKIVTDKDTTEEDIIVLDDEDEEDVKNKSHNTRNRDRNASIDSTKELVTFHQQPITEHDYKTLAEDEYLNDNIINFYLTWLYQNLSQKHKEMIHIYSSHFYTRLKSKPSKKDKASQKNKSLYAYEKVKGWTKKINIFDKRMLIFPICEEYHWYLVVVCNHGYVLSTTRERDYDAKRSYQQKYGESKGFNPFIMVLDSLGGTHSTAISKIRTYLSFEHMEKKDLPMTFSKEKMSEKHPPIPTQPNSTDCGLFLLHYVELIFRDPEVFLGAMLPDLSRWFNSTDIQYKREDVALLIQKISNDNGGSNPRFPRIKFPAKRRKQKSDVIDVDATQSSDEDVPLATRRLDPRLKKVKGGSLGELLASKTPSRSSRFTGNYKEQEAPPSPPSRRSTPPKSPSPRRKSPGLFESPMRISFEIKKKKHGPKMPETQDFNGKDTSSSWESVPLGRSSRNHPDGDQKRFTLRRNNAETNPDSFRSKRKYRADSSDDEDAINSKKDMYNLLMRSTSSKRNRKDS